MKLALEDGFNDILSKAQKGQGVSTEVLSQRSSLDEATIRGLRRGEFAPESVAKAADALGLRAEPLMAIARGDWLPEQPQPMDGFRQFSTPFHEWQVNAFLVWNRETRRAVAFDTGTDAAPMIEFLRQERLSLEALLLTHTHWDHVEGVSALREAFSPRIIVNALEGSDVAGAEGIREGFNARLAGFEIEAMETPGHTEGGTTYLVGGLSQPLAVVGDALFAGSMGAANVSYEEALKGLNRILELPEQTVLAPGHGPVTTVAEERRMNCFWRPDR